MHNSDFQLQPGLISTKPFIPPGRTDTVPLPHWKLHNIYVVLSVPSRLQASARAGELGVSGK